MNSSNLHMKLICALSISLLVGLALVSSAQGPNDSQSNTSALRVSNKHYSLPATPANVQWGWYDVRERPKLTIHSGDTVSIETISHSLGQIKPGVEMDEIMKLRKENDGGGPHSITGPIYVEEAEPGDTLASEFPEGFVRYYKLDLSKMATEFKQGKVTER